ncbi:MAG: manganese catalase family protein [Bacilli bacterium]
MWKYEKKLEYPININKKDLQMARAMTAQYGGPDSELTAALTYLNQRYTMPDERGFALLTDIGSEELAHFEMIATMMVQLMKGATAEELKHAGLAGLYAQHDHAIFPTDANGVPFSSSYINSTGDYRADLESDMAGEQRARVTYEHLMDLTNDPDVLAPLSFLRQREVVHYERFKELKDYYLNQYKKSTENF